MNVAVIVLFILLLVFIAAYIVFSILTKSFISKKNVLYFIPLFILLIAMYSIGYAYGYGSYYFESFLSCMVSSLKGFAFDVTGQYVNRLCDDNLLFKVTFYTTIVLSGLTTISTLLGFAKVFLTNALKLFIRIFLKSPDFVIGTGKDAIEFAKNDKGSILLIDKNDKNLDYSIDFRKNLFLKNIVYLRSDLSSKKISKYLSFTKGKIHLFFFQNDARSIENVTQLIKKIDISKKHEIEIYVYANNENSLFIDKMLTEARSVAKSNITMALSFNPYKILGREFSKQYNFAKFLPSSFLKDATLEKGKNVRVVMLGFGKVSSSILEASILDNQFIGKAEDKYVIKPIEYDIYDENKKAFERKIIRLFERKNTKDRDIKTAIINTHEINLKKGIKLECLSKESEDAIPLPDDNTFVFYFVNVGNPLHNLTIANSLLEQISTNNAVIFYNVDTKDEEVHIPSRIQILPFGLKNDLLSKDKIIDEDLYTNALQVNDIYNKLHGQEEKFSTRNIVEKLSNYYADMNLEFKLNLLGLTIIENGQPLNKSEYMDTIYKGENPIKTYDDYFAINTINALRFQEHARWVTYYLVNDFEPMNLDEVFFNEKENKVIHKDLIARKHACITTYYKLDELHKKETKLLFENQKEQSFDEILSKVETYQYDTQIVDNLFDKRPIYRLYK